MLSFVLNALKTILEITKKLKEEEVKLKRQCSMCSHNVGDTCTKNKVPFPLITVKCVDFVQKGSSTIPSKESRIFFKREVVEYSFIS